MTLIVYRREVLSPSLPAIRREFGPVITEFKLIFPSVIPTCSPIKNFDSNPQSLSFLGARRTYFHIYRITMNAVGGFTV